MINVADKIVSLCMHCDPSFITCYLINWIHVFAAHAHIPLCQLVTREPGDEAG